MKAFFSVALLVLLISGCGVKGDPIPPGTPADIGRGKPRYRSPVGEMNYPQGYRASPDPEKDVDENEADEDNEE